MECHALTNVPELGDETRPVVLVVEDEHHVCELIVDILQLRRFDVVCAKTDADALDLLWARNRYACLVLDVNLRQGLTGFDVARFARNLMPDLPILFVSGEATRTSFCAHGVPGSHFLAKPFTADELLASVGTLVDGADVR